MKWYTEGNYKRSWELSLERKRNPPFCREACTSGCRSILFEKGCASVLCHPLLTLCGRGGEGGRCGDRAIPPPEVVPLERQAAQVGAVWTQCHLSPIHPTPDMFILSPTLSHIFTQLFVSQHINYFWYSHNHWDFLDLSSISDCGATFLMTCLNKWR